MKRNIALMVWMQIFKWFKRLGLASIITLAVSLTALPFEWIIRSITSQQTHGMQACIKWQR